MCPWCQHQASKVLETRPSPYGVWGAMGTKASRDIAQ